MNNVGTRRLESRPAWSFGTEWVLWARDCQFNDAGLAAFFGVSLPQFQRFFAAVFFMPPDYWLGQVRLWEAVRLVCAGRKPETLAGPLGFVSVRHLLEEFHDYHGCGPVEFAVFHSSRKKKERSPWPGFPLALWDEAFRILCTPVAAASALRHAARPDPDLLTLCLHQRLCDGVPEAGQILRDWLSPPLIGSLSNEFPAQDARTMAGAAEEALASYFAHPVRFNPLRCTLPAFLQIEARTRLRKLDRIETGEGRLEAARIDRARNGDQQAFGELAKAAEPALRKEALRLIKSQCVSESGAMAEAEDLVQETLLAGWHDLADFRGDSGFVSWLAAILRNKARAWWRKKPQRSAVPLEEVSGADGGVAAPALSVPSRAARELDLRELWAAVQHCLKPREFRLLRQYFVDGKPLNKIAATERLPLGTVKTLIYEALKKLRAANRIESFAGWTLDL